MSSEKGASGDTEERSGYYISLVFQEMTGGVEKKFSEQRRKCSFFWEMGKKAWRWLQVCVGDFRMMVEGLRDGELG